jgi:hypothetical protein
MRAQVTLIRAQVTAPLTEADQAEHLRYLLEPVTADTGGLRLSPPPLG